MAETGRRASGRGRKKRARRKREVFFGHRNRKRACFVQSRSTSAVFFHRTESQSITGCSAVGSAPALGAGCREFESPHSDQESECRIGGVRILFRRETRSPVVTCRWQVTAPARRLVRTSIFVPQERKCKRVSPLGPSPYGIIDTWFHRDFCF